MNAKQYLKQLKSLKQMIECKQEQILMLRGVAEGVTSTLKQIVVQTSRSSGKVENAVNKMVDVENELSKDIESFRALMLEIMGKIDLIPDESLRLVLTYIYVNMMTFEETAERMDKSVRWVYEMHQRAIKAFEVVLNLVV